MRNAIVFGLAVFAAFSFWAALFLASLSSQLIRLP